MDSGWLQDRYPRHILIHLPDMDSFRIALAQLNPKVGDISGNRDRMLEARQLAMAEGADLVLYPELMLVGYPPEDLVLRPSVQAACEEALEVLRQATTDGGPAMAVPTIQRTEEGLYNAVAVLNQGERVGEVRKHHLPNYGVFDESRLFRQGEPYGPFDLKGVPLGVLICEDMWHGDVAAHLRQTGAELLLVPNGSPFDLAKPDLRASLAKARVAETGLPMVYLNLVGGQDELVFDGATFVMNADGSMPVTLPAWEETVVVTHWRKKGERWVCETLPAAPMLDREENIYRAMLMGLRDYVEKNNFPGVVLGLSGGIDSALSAAVAVDALGPERVHCVMMPSRYTSHESDEDARACAEALGCRYDEVPIEPAVEAYGDMLAPLFAGTQPDVTEENIQARIRAQILLAISNKFGGMVLTTGNKSEMAVGYATLYGDMCGGYSVVKDVYKTTVYRLSEWRNAHRPPGGLGPEGVVIPANILTKAPTAELRENQKDQDSLPPYSELDAILEGLVEQEQGVKELVAEGHDPETVQRVQNLLFRAEYKRRQAPPGVKITTRNFGRDRRYPITNGFRED